MNDKSTVLLETGGLIYKARKAAELTQEGLAIRTGMARATIANIELGRQNVTVWQLIQLARVLKVKVATLIPSGDVDSVNYRRQAKVKLANRQIKSLKKQLSAARARKKKFRS